MERAGVPNVFMHSVYTQKIFEENCGPLSETTVSVTPWQTKASFTALKGGLSRSLVPLK
jgi:hypothetical protein